MRRSRPNRRWVLPETSDQRDRPVSPARRDWRGSEGQPERRRERGRVRENAETIVDTIDLNSKTGRFPEAYLGKYDGEFDTITYEWQTRRSPVDAKIQATTDGEFIVQAGRSDAILTPRCMPTIGTPGSAAPSTSMPR